MNPISGCLFYQYNNSSRYRGNRTPDPFRHCEGTYRVISPDPASSFYLPERERFATSFAEIDRKRREEEIHRKNYSDYKRREFKANKEIFRWQNIFDNELTQSMKLEKRRNELNQGQKNNLNDSYNPITSEYYNTQQGMKLKCLDEKKRTNYNIRLKHIDSKMNSPYNVINGIPRISIKEQ
ncbi:unnamed protein product [Blepharisma stoltei]|uniref:Uncharacterized protein n=1 Tax=Blepharisma stoltei TaxID=1481888 RepID=A0AAU9KR64_9CILI|nr:unnamed protein product [Blepharisma stoltei]